MARQDNKGTKHKPILPHSDPSLLTLIIDITPSEWQHRDTIRLVKDKISANSKKPSSGPANFNEYISSILAFCFSFGSLNRANTLNVIAVAGDNVALVYPRIGKAHGYMESTVHDPTEFVGSKTDARKLYDGVHLGITELILKHTENSSVNEKNGDSGTKAQSNSDNGAAMVSYYQSMNQLAGCITFTSVLIICSLSL